LDLSVTINLGDEDDRGGNSEVTFDDLSKAAEAADEAERLKLEAEQELAAAAQRLKDVL
jgi:hypothetical protein